MRAGLFSLFAAAAFAASIDKAPLADAVQRQDFAAARTLLTQHADVNATLSDGSTALLWAAHWDDAPLVDLLLRAGAKAQAANRYGISPLLEACENGDAAIVEKLLQAGADPNTAQPEGETALMTAARSGDVDSVRVLIDRGARVNAVESWRGQSALMWAAAEKHADVVELLTERGADVNAQSRAFDFTHIKVKPGSVPMNYPRGGFTALLFAAREDDLESGRVLLNAKADMNRGDPDGVTPLIEAIVNFHFDFAAFLLEHGADPNARDHRGRSPLYAAVDIRSPDTSTRPDPRPPDKLGAIDLIKALLARGANPNAPLIAPLPPRGPLDDIDPVMGAGATPFLRAAKLDDAEVMRLLLDRGADARITTAAHATALMVAAGVGWRDGKSHGSEPNAIEAIQLCLDRGVDINAANDQGRTALHGATQRGAEAVVAYLISRGADVTAKDKDGFNALGRDTLQTFAVQALAVGTSTGGLAPSTPVTVACADCSGAVTTFSSVRWAGITSVSGDLIGFNVFSNTQSSPRSGIIQIKKGRNRMVLTIQEAGSTEPLLNRQAAFLYQQVLGREPDAGRRFPALGRLGADLLDSQEARDTDFQAMAMYQAINGSAPGYPAYLELLQALRNGTPAASQSTASQLTALQFTAMLNRSSCGRNPRATVECLYQNMLGRAPAPAELSAGIMQQPFPVFTSICTGPEFQSTGGFKADHTNTLYVTMLYYLLLERAPTESELAAWLKVANGGSPGIYYNQLPDAVGPDSAQLTILGNASGAGLMGGAEFLARFQ
jgi:ankyrin repeat protein